MSAPSLAALSLAFSLTFASTAQAAELRLAMPGLKGVNVSAAEAEFFSEHLATQLGLAGVKVFSAADLRELLGHERAKALAGCDTGGTCLADLTGGLGADALVVGSVGKFDQTFQINLKVLDATSGAVKVAVSRRGTGASAALDELTAGAKQIASELKRLAPAASSGKSGKAASEDRTLTVRCEESCEVQLDLKAGFKKSDRLWEFRNVAPGDHRMEALTVFRRTLWKGFVKIPEGTSVFGTVGPKGFRLLGDADVTPPARPPPSLELDAGAVGVAQVAPKDAGLASPPDAGPVAVVDPSTVFVRCARPCSLLLDREKRGSSPSEKHVLHNVAAGAHALEVRFAVGKPGIAHVTVRPRSELYLHGSEGQLRVTQDKDAGL